MLRPTDKVIQTHTTKIIAGALILLTCYVREEAAQHAERSRIDIGLRNVKFVLID